MSWIVFGRYISSEVYIALFTSRVPNNKDFPPFWSNLKLTVSASSKFLCFCYPNTSICDKAIKGLLNPFKSVAWTGTT